MRLGPERLSAVNEAAAGLPWRAWAPWLAMLGLGLWVLWLNQALTIEAWGENWWDERLFVEQARSIARGQWLGEYGPQTLSKGPVYPLFIAVNFYLDLPLRTTEQLVYLLSAGLLAAVAARQVGRWPAFWLFTLLALNPVQWTPLQRVLRENLYGTEALLLFALGLRLFLQERAAPLGRPLGGRLWGPLALGAVLAAYWLTREEHVWLLPSLGLMLAFWLAARVDAWRRARPRPGRWLVCEARYLVLPLLVAAAAIAAVNTLNWKHYGVWRTNDFSGSPGFTAAYGALTRIKTDVANPRYLFTAEARRKAYAVSPALRELRTFLEGEVAADWIKTTCTWADLQDPFRCRELMSGWLPWQFRDMVNRAQYYQNARQAEAYYQRLAGEINAACADGRLDCLPPRATLLPPIPPGWEWYGRILERMGPAARVLLGFGGGWEAPRKSAGNPESLQIFADLTHGPLAATTERSEGFFLRGWIAEPGGDADVSLELRPGTHRQEQFHRTSKLYPRKDVGYEWPAVGFILTTNHRAEDVELVVRRAGLPPLKVPLAADTEPGTVLFNQPDVVMVIDAAGPAEWAEDLWMTWRLNKSRTHIMKGVAGFYAKAMPFAAGAALLAFLAVLAVELRRRALSGGTIVAAALLGAAALRVAMLAFIDVTSFHVLETHYMAPAHPLLLAFTGLSLALAVRLLMRRSAPATAP